MRVCMISNKHFGTQARLESQLESARIPYLHYTLPVFTWRRKTLAELEIAKAFPAETLIFVDPWDVQMQAGPNELFGLEAEGFFEKPVFPADCGCWPDEDKAEQFPQTRTAWRFINGGAPSGRGAEIAQAIEYGLERFGPPGDVADLYDPDGTDQRFYTSVFLDYVKAGKGVLDSDTRLQMALCGAYPRTDYITDTGGRVVNVKSGHCPIFVHANGFSMFPKTVYLVRKTAEHLLFNAERQVVPTCLQS